MALHDAIAGIGTDEKAIMETLRNKSPAEVEAIRAEYLSAYGESLDAALAGDLDEGNEIDQANALLAGDNDKADAIALDDAMRGGFLGLGTSEGTSRRRTTACARRCHARAQARALDVRTDGGRRSAAGSARSRRTFGSATRTLLSTRKARRSTVLERAFDTGLERTRLDLANSLQKNDLVAADAARIEIERQGVYASDEKLVNVMRSSNTTGRSRHGGSTRARHATWSSRRKMEAWRAERRSDGKVLSEEEISRRRIALERQMNAEIEAGAKVDAKASTQALTAVYEKKYRPSLAYELAFNMSGSDAEAAQALLRNGGWLSPLEEVDFATKGDGADEDQLKKTFATLTKAEIQAMRVAWNRKHPGKDFDEMLRGELSGRDEVDIMDMVERHTRDTERADRPGRPPDQP